MVKGSKKASTTVSGQYVTEELRKLILSSEFHPGLRIGQEMLAERFAASRMPVREALRALEAEGLVTIVPNSGAWVSKLDDFEFNQTYKMREVIEPLAIRESIGNLTDAQVARILQLANEIEKTTTSTSVDVESFLRLDREFHLLTYAGARFGQLTDLVLRMWNTTQHYRRVLVTKMSPSELEATNADHFLIADSIERGDVETAAQMVHVHIRRTQRILEQGLPDGSS